MGELKNAFALVRPPGHMAEHNEAKVGCYFNNVAIAAKYLTTQKLSNRVLIVDWVRFTTLTLSCLLAHAQYFGDKSLFSSFK